MSCPLSPLPSPAALSPLRRRGAVRFDLGVDAKLDLDHSTVISRSGDGHCMT
jgi:hypothetical protein